MKVCEEINRLASCLRGFTSVPVYGGTPIDRQMRALRNGAHVVVGTPGRIMDHLRRKTLRTDAIKLCILDEADRMLDMGFREDMEVILGDMREDRQALFFSATMNRGVEGLIRNFSRDAQQISIERKALTGSVNGHIQRTPDTDGPIKLADLIPLGAVRIKVVLAGKDAAILNGAPQCHTRPN